MKKGFTLIELLAVIVVIAIVSTIGFLAISDKISGAREAAYKQNEKTLVNLAEYYMFINEIDYPIFGNKVVITLAEIKASNLIKDMKNINMPSQSCTGYVEVTKGVSRFEYLPFLNCGSYITPGYNGLEAPFVTVEGDGARDYYRGIDITTNGYIAVGESESNSDNLLNKNKGYYDGIITKYDNSGNIIWSKNYGGTDQDYFSAVINHNDNYIAVGYSASNDNELENLAKGSYDAILVKYNSNGDIIYKKSYGGTGADYFYDIILADDGYIVVGGSSSTNGDLSTVTKYGGTDAILVKYNFNGDIIYKTNFGGSSTEYFYGVDLNNNHIYTVGSSTSTNGNLTSKNKGGYDSVIAKFDLSGNLISNTNYGGTGADYYRAVTVTNDSVVAVGYSPSTDGDLAAVIKYGGTDATIVKYDFNLNQVWSKNYGGSSTEYFYDIAHYQNNILAVGTSASTNGTLVGLNKGSYDGTLVVYDGLGNIISNKNLGGSSGDYFYGLKQVGVNIAVVGTSASTNSDHASLNIGDTDATIFKIDASYNKVWNKNFGGGPGIDYLFHGAYSLNNYVLVGHSSSKLEPFNLNKGGYDAQIIKYDMQGNKKWHKNFGGTSTDYFYSVAKDSDFFVAAGSSSSSNGDLGPITKYGGTDAILVKYDDNGEKIFNKNFGGSGTDIFYGITKTTTGYVMVGSTASNDGQMSGLNKGGTDGIIIKTDFEGNLVWIKTFGGSGTDVFKSVHITNTGYMVAGNSNSTNGDLSGKNKGGYDAVVVKYDYDGNIIWQENYGGTGNDYFESVVKGYVNFYLVGNSNSTDGDLESVSKKGGIDSIVVKYDPDGNLIWNKNFGGTGTDNFTGIIFKENQLFISGSSASTNGDLASVSKKGGTDATLTKFDIDGNLIYNLNYGGSGTDSFAGVLSARDGIIAMGNASSINYDLAKKGSGYIDFFSIAHKE